LKAGLNRLKRKIATQDAKSDELQYAIELLRKALSGPNPTPKTVNSCVLDIKEIVGELSSLTSKFSTAVKKFNIMDAPKF
jgi:hypothetical protein